MNALTETPEQKAARLKAFYAGVAELREAKRHLWAGQPDVDCSDDYDGGEFDFVTSRGLNSGLRL